MESYRNASKQIAVLAFPFGTHAVPLLNFVLQLSDACPHTMSSFLSTQQSNNSTFPKTLDKIKSFNVWDGLPEGYTFRGNPHKPVDYFLKAVPGNFIKAIDVIVLETGKPIDCLITDAFYAFGADIADELNIPWVALWTASPRALFVHVDSNIIRHHVRINGPKGKPLDFLPDFSSIRVADLPNGLTSGDIDAPMPALLYKMGVSLSRAMATATNSYEDLDNTVVNMLKLSFSTFLNVGPFNLVSVSSSTVDDSHGTLDWMSKHEAASVVYISFGSVITPPPHELHALCEALEECEFPYLWPFFGDQQLNTRTVEVVWGFGLGLEGGTLTKGAKKALKLILCSQERKKMREKIRVQKELACKAVKPNGSSNENFKTLVKVVSNTYHQVSG
ncbi:hypothetical protein GOBAR_AA21805 [Gossypium barbadense]|uniref:UDP-glycosyltransferases domain-containing protein n=1 Tax=Gossypium barbadense TaxID=3634 RepID=A0A2P5X686_GOSBA|nr:hypothetical protein GOBAR_AA21805 [Gossypium barbadense]